MRTKQNLVMASREWATRPVDQRFWTLDELYNKSKLYAEQCKTKQVVLADCEVLPMDNNDVVLMGPDRKSAASFQHYSFGQVATLAQAPAAYLRALPAPLAAGCLNDGLARLSGQSTLLLHQNGGLQLRCVTSDKYSRIWNYEIAELALALEGEGWRTPPARPCGIDGVPVRRATEDDVLRKSAHPDLGIKVGDEISPAGLYCSDHDLFIFQVNEDFPIDGGGGETLYRGVFWKNSEVGDARFTGTCFLYDSVCGNHIVWGAKIVAEISIRHIGNAHEMWAEAMAAATIAASKAASEDENRIRMAKQHLLGSGRDEVVNAVFSKFGRGGGFISQKECQDAYTLAERYADMHGDDPNTAWGYAAGITRLSQQQWADKRDQLDRVAGKVLEVAF